MAAGHSAVRPDSHCRVALKRAGYTASPLLQPIRSSVGILYGCFSRPVHAFSSRVGHNLVSSLDLGIVMTAAATQHLLGPFPGLAEKFVKTFKSYY